MYARRAARAAQTGHRRALGGVARLQMTMVHHTALNITAFRFRFSCGLSVGTVMVLSLLAANQAWVVRGSARCSPTLASWCG